jgi:hypothetical protein
MGQTKKIDKKRWSEFLSMFSNGNRGRLVTIEVEDMALGDEELTNAMPLMGIDYDPAGKGDDFVITTGLDAVDYTHKISGPTELWELQDDNGKTVVLEIINRKGSKTILSFKS